MGKFRVTEDKDQHTKVAFTAMINGISGVGSFLCEKLSKTVRMRDTQCTAAEILSAACSLNVTQKERRTGTMSLIYSNV